MDTADWDLVVIDNLFNPHGYAIALRLKAEKGVPFIILDTCGVTSTISATTMSLARNPILKAQTYPMEPSDSQQTYTPSLFVHRLYNSAFTAYQAFIFNLFVQHSYMPTIGKFGAQFSWLNLYKGSEFMLIDTLDKAKLPAAGNGSMNCF
jgi:hypothetical protein